MSNALILFGILFGPVLLGGLVAFGTLMLGLDRFDADDWWMPAMFLAGGLAVGYGGIFSAEATPLSGAVFGLAACGALWLAWRMVRESWTS